VDTGQLHFAHSPATGIVSSLSYGEGDHFLKIGLPPLSSAAVNLAAASTVDRSASLGDGASRTRHPHAPLSEQHPGGPVWSSASQCCGRRPSIEQLAGVAENREAAQHCRFGGISGTRREGGRTGGLGNSFAWTCFQSVRGLSRLSGYSLIVFSHGRRASHTFAAFLDGVRQPHRRILGAGAG